MNTPVDNKWTIADLRYGHRWLNPWKFSPQEMYNKITEKISLDVANYSFWDMEEAGESLLEDMWPAVDRSLSRC